MATSSFRPEFRARVQGYRTPSPPRLAVEPLSPPGSAHPHYTGGRGSIGKKRKLNSQPSDSVQALNSSYKRGSAPLDTRPLPHTDYVPSALDVFAAVATSPTLAQDLKSPFSAFPVPSDFRPKPLSSNPPAFERSSKRTKSELVGVRPSAFNTERPTTSHVNNTSHANNGHWDPAGATDKRSNVSKGIFDRFEPDHSRVITRPADDQTVLQQDAELLLSFSRGSFAQRSQPIHQRDDIKDHKESPRETKPAEAAPTLPVETTNEKIVSPKPNGVPDADLGFHDFPATQQAEAALIDPHRPREHRGWPKGKPRGPRAPGAVRKKRSDAGARKVDVKPKEPRGGRKKGKEQANAEALESPRDSTVQANSEDLTGRQRPRRNSSLLSRLGLLSPAPHQHRLPPRSASLPPRLHSSHIRSPKQQDKSKRIGQMPQQVEFCPACQLRRNKINGFQDLWINCNGCKSWVHATCAGFDTERKVKEVDKFYCKKCEVKHGTTTFVRKSSRAHASVDYAGLHEGKVRTAVDIPDHHYIGPIKEGTIQFQPEMFPRMPPELVTADYFAKCGGWTEPILIPASMNPRPLHPDSNIPETSQANGPDGITEPEHENFNRDYEYDLVADHGQDRLDMVIPRGLTVRRAAELYGPDEKVDVIDVKLQEGEDRRWTMRQWADYYEAEGEKPVRNVISLEVSQSMLGRLIRRPKVVRDLDLQDSVWPAEDTAKGIVPRVQFYCLMSVADCYTDFHIDFGGSSVYYHILKGRKTFFFIPPKPKYLKKYEDWCNSPDQNSVFLGNETKECYRVDLYPGDTMLIPSGWIHAVWTPENSLVIGGNFLTRLNFRMQIQVNDIEKATNVTRKFRYPYFQKILWLTALQFLQQDPIPSTVVDRLCAGGLFERNKPIWYELHDDEHDSVASIECHSYRHYPQGEIQGLPDLIRYLYRTVMISIGKVPGVSKSTQDAVIRSMPKHCGNHLDFIRTFAMWAAWKRGNEEIPSWAYPDAPLSELDAGIGEKKLSAAAQRRIDRQALHEAHKAASDRRMLRTTKDETQIYDGIGDDGAAEDKRPKSPTDIRRLACEDCRRRRRRCSHNIPIGEAQAGSECSGPRFGVIMLSRSPTPVLGSNVKADTGDAIIKAEPVFIGNGLAGMSVAAQSAIPAEQDLAMAPQVDSPHNLLYNSVLVQLSTQQMQAFDAKHLDSDSNLSQPKTTACLECRRNKRLCVHVENGNVNLSKVFESPNPSSQASMKRPRSEDEAQLSNGIKKSRLTLEHGPRSNEAVGAGTLAQDGDHLAQQLNTYGMYANHGETSNTKATGIYEARSEIVGTDASAHRHLLSNGIGHDTSVKPMVSPELGKGSILGKDSRLRTPFHQQIMSSANAAILHSPPTSPLTDLEPSPKMPSIESKLNGVMHTRVNGYRQDFGASRGSVTGAPSPNKIVSQLESAPSFTKPNSVPKKRSSSRSMSRESGGGGSRVSASPKSKKSPSVPRLLTPAEEAEAESLKLARMLAVEDYSLRRRRS